MSLKILILAWTFVCGAYCIDDEIHLHNGVNATNKDMFVINAVVYQVGILVNTTNDRNNTNETNPGADESITFYQHHGSNLNLSNIPKPLLTNVTKQSLLQTVPSSIILDRQQAEAAMENSRSSFMSAIPDSSIRNEKTIRSKRNTNNLDNIKVDYMKTESGESVLSNSHDYRSPISSISILKLNTSLTDIPIPIPNNSVIHYSRVNALITTPNITVS